MNIIETLIGSGLLVMSSYMSYRLIKNRADLFESKTLLRASSTVGFLALGLCAFVGLLYYSLPGGGEGTTEVSPSPSKKSSASQYDRTF
jgi:hypothetical protein